MKLAEIRIGGQYAVRLDYRRFVSDFPGIGAVPHASGGYRASVLALEKNEAGRTLVRVELTGRELRTKEVREENPDGTWTVWWGYVVDENDNPVEDDTTLELLVQSSQVVCEWTEAVVQQTVESLDRDWKYLIAVPSWESQTET